jgi:tetratricopeptide (TPR) repeat protein
MSSEIEKNFVELSKSIFAQSPDITSGAIVGGDIRAAIIGLIIQAVWGLFNKSNSLEEKIDRMLGSSYKTAGIYLRDAYKNRDSDEKRNRYLNEAIKYFKKSINEVNGVFVIKAHFLIALCYFFLEEGKESEDWLEYTYQAFEENLSQLKGIEKIDAQIIAGLSKLYDNPYMAESRFNDALSKCDKYQEKIKNSLYLPPIVAGSFAISGTVFSLGRAFAPISIPCMIGSLAYSLYKINKIPEDYHEMDIRKEIENRKEILIRLKYIQLPQVKKLKYGTR